MKPSEKEVLFVCVFHLCGIYLVGFIPSFFHLVVLSLVFFILWDSSLVFFILVVFIFVGFIFVGYIFVGYIFVGFIFVGFIFVGFIFWDSSCGIHPPSQKDIYSAMSEGLWTIASPFFASTLLCVYLLASKAYLHLDTLRLNLICV